MNKRIGEMKAGEQFVVEGETFTVTDLPAEEMVAGEVHATSATRGGFWFHADEEV